MEETILFPVPKKLVEKLIKICSNTMACEGCGINKPTYYSCASCGEMFITCSNSCTSWLTCQICEKIFCLKLTCINEYICSNCNELIRSCKRCKDNHKCSI